MSRHNQRRSQGHGKRLNVFPWYRQILLLGCAWLHDGNLNAQLFSGYGSSGNESSYSAALHPDGSILQFGQQAAGSAQDALLLKISQSGRLSKAVRFGGSGRESGISVAATRDSGIVVTGSTSQGGIGSLDIYVSKFDKNENLLWSKAYGGAADDEPQEVITSSYGGFYVCGYTRSFPNAGFNTYLLRLNDTGAIIWSKVLFTNTVDIGYRMLEKDSSLYLVSTVNTSTVFGRGDINLTKMSLNGNVLWNKTYGNGGNESGWRLLETFDKKMVLLSQNTSLSGNSFKQLVFTKLDTSGNILFNKVISQGSDATDGFDVIQMPDSSFSLCGHLYHSASATWRAYAAVLNKNGNLLRAKSATLTQGSEFWRILRLPSGKFVYAGTSFAPAGGNSDFLLGIGDSLLQMSCLQWSNQTLSAADAQLSESGKNKIYQFTQGGSMNILPWTASIVTTGIQENIINLNKGLSTALPAFIDRCSFDSVLLDAGPGIQQYFWYSGETTRTKQAKTFGTHALRFTRNFCTNTDSVQLRKVFPMVLTLPRDTCLAAGDSIGVKPENGYTYQWSNGSKNARTTILQPGLLSIIMTHSTRNCTAMDTVNVVSNGLEIRLQTDTLRSCLKDNRLSMQSALNFAIPGDALRGQCWQLGADTISTAARLSFSAPDTGLYQFRNLAISQRGCRDTAYPTFRVFAHPIALISPQDTLFCQSNAPYVFKHRGQRADASQHRFEWYINDTLRGQAADSFSRTFPLPGKQKIALTLRSAQGCSDSSEHDFRIVKNPVAAIHTADALSQCQNGNRFTLCNDGLDENGKRPPFSYWNAGDGSAYLGTHQLTHSYADTGTFRFRLQVSTAEGCRDSAQITLQVLASPKAALDLPDTSLCTNAGPFRFKNTSAGRSMADRFRLQTGDGFEHAIDDTFSYRYRREGFYNYALIRSLPSGCADTAIGRLHVRPSPVTSLRVNNDSQCLTGNLFAFELTGPTDTEPVTWNWNGINQTGFRLFNHRFNSTGVFNVRSFYTNDAQCADTQEIAVRVKKVPNADFSFEAVCEGFPLPLRYTGSEDPRIAALRWTIDGQQAYTGRNVFHPVSQTAWMDVQLLVESEEACSDTLNRRIQAVVFPKPDAAFTWQQLSASFSEDVWMASPVQPSAAVHNWQFSDGSKSDLPFPQKRISQDQTLNTLHIAEDANGCRDTFASTQIFSFVNALFVPNAFTPNADPLNQVFRPALTKPLRDYHFRIYNRWGELLFYTQDPAAGWDGTYRGQLQPEGVYVYAIELDGASYRFRGTFHLLR